MKHTWKPTITGILDIFGGIAFLGYLIAASVGYNSWLALVWLPLAIPPLVAGFCALRRRIWWLALAGSIFLAIPLGLVSVILIALSKEEFKQTQKVSL
jgi:hypothetical protein